MDCNLFLLHLKEFVSRHGISEDIPSRIDRLFREATELDEAEGDEAIRKEAADVAIIAFHIMMLAGSANPLYTMYQKLQEVAAREKYQALAEKVKSAQI